MQNPGRGRDGRGVEAVGAVSCVVQPEGAVRVRHSDGQHDREVSLSPRTDLPLPSPAGDSAASRERDRRDLAHHVHRDTVRAASP